MVQALMNIEVSEEAGSRPSHLLCPLGQNSLTLFIPVCVPANLIHREAFRIKAWRFLVFFFPSSKGSSASECCYVDVKTYKLLWRSIFLAQQPEKKIHTYTQHTNMQAIIPVSNQSRVTICRSSCTSFLVFLLLCFFFL